MITLHRSPALDHGPYVQGAQGDGLGSLMDSSDDQGRLCQDPARQAVLRT